ncbi:Fibroblast growth factor receptor 1 [Rhizoctonia solani]|uniref:Fibroblast growth factor receptor 1 n=1 Tax=Rhizoctonia solani TaxID=456999 RepID=A0A0K6FMG1_9AGAM|nr:Fibroblast growth factor receptor 1 [Rhizoctonia solani]
MANDVYEDIVPHTLSVKSAYKIRVEPPTEVVAGGSESAQKEYQDNEETRTTVNDVFGRVRLLPGYEVESNASMKRLRTPSPMSNPSAHPISSKRARTDAEVGAPTDTIGTHACDIEESLDKEPITTEGERSSLLVCNVQNVRSKEMTSLEMFNCLKEHGCPDLQASIDASKFSSCRVAEGSFGDVWKGQLTDGTAIAVKVLRYGLLSEDGSKSIKRAMREIYNWSKLEHKNVHKLLGVTMFEERIGMVSNWMEYGTLQHYLRHHNSADRCKLCLQVAEGVAYIHNENMIHGDLKASNILVSSDGTPKLTDFDHSIISDCSLQFSATTRIGGGTLRWMAPELVIDEDEDEDEEQEAQEKTRQTDVYALGMTLLEIMTNAIPYSECQREPQIIHRLSRKKYPKRPMEHFPETQEGNRMWNLLTHCWDHNPTSRPTADDVVMRLSVL